MTDLDRLDAPTPCDHRDDRGSTVMLVRDDRYECAVCGALFRLVSADHRCSSFLDEALNSGDGTYKP